MSSSRPDLAALRRARRRTLRDVIAPGLRVLFCGINPGLYSTAIGHHFGRPGNRFWKALHASGFTPRLFSPSEDATLLDLGIGITNLCPRTTAGADELTADELERGGRELVAKAVRYRPRVVALLGIGAYRVGFGRPEASIGRQNSPTGEALTWVLPNPSGLNAHYGLQDLVHHFRRLRLVVEETSSGRRRR
ncbi:MAG TPA: G/U mismatch-specific DNA glycosylase [Vicinamibacteria bacterium]|nr:G/U mismatch-specific DNA glycosylase [Vicinamibacteria bacterium]